MSLDAVFFALRDETRRAVVRRLLDEETATASELAEGLPITRQAVSKHLAALAQAGLVSSTRSGRENRYALSPEPLADATAWIDDVGREWEGRLQRLRRHLEGDGEG